MTLAPPRRTGSRPERAARTQVPRGRRRSRWTPWLFLLVPLGLLATFTYVPVVNLFWYSVTDWDGFTDPRFVGLDNYVRLFTRPELFRVFVISVYYLVASFVQLVLALWFATVLSFKVRFRALFKGILFFPYLVNGVAIGFIFLYFFQPGGTLDSVLALAGLHPHQYWLGDRDTVNVSLAGVSVWRYTGLNFVLFLGAIQSVSPDVYEAAELDGANRWQQFRYLIAPSIRPILGLASILSISGSLSVFEIPFVMTGGANGSRTFVIQTVDLAFKFDKVGLASAAAIVLLAVILLLTWLQRVLLPEERVDLT